MKKSDIIVGLLVKPHPTLFSGHGKIIEIKEAVAVVQWYNELGEEDGFAALTTDKIIDCFEYGGWTVLSSLEKELI
jgi:hypothetical protein